jgi:predicted amidohydrolase
VIGFPRMRLVIATLLLLRKKSCCVTSPRFLPLSMAASTGTAAVRAESFVLAAVQMTSTNDKAYNLRATSALVERAVRGGAQLCCLPECSSFMGSPSAEKGMAVVTSADDQGQPTRVVVDSQGHPTRVVDAAEGLDGPYVQALQQLAKRCAVWLSVGGFPEAVATTSSNPKKVYNTHFIVSSGGEVVSPVYRKIHLFDNPLTGLVESRTTEAGSDVCAVDLPGLARLGLTVCYDVRFPELYGALCRPLPPSDGGDSSAGRTQGARHGLGAEIVLVRSHRCHELDFIRNYARHLTSVFLTSRYRRHSQSPLGKPIG